MANDILNALMNAVVNKYDNGSRKTTVVDSPNGRLGFLSQDQIPNDVVPARYQTRYGIGIDNVGSPYRGVMDKEISTPLGVIDYGYDGDTVAAGFTPNTSRTVDYYTGGNGQPMHFDYTTLGENSDAALRYGTEGNPNNPTYFAEAFLGGDKNYLPDFDRTVNTPLGSLNIARNTEEPNSAYVDFQPNDYIQALLSLLKKQR